MDREGNGRGRESHRWEAKARMLTVSELGPNASVTRVRGDERKQMLQFEPKGWKLPHRRILQQAWPPGRIMKRKKKQSCV